MKTKQEWLPRRVFATAYARRWQISEPTHETCARWARKWKEKGLARWVPNASVGAGGYWEFSTKALALAPTPSGPKPKTKLYISVNSPANTPLAAKLKRFHSKPA